MHTQEHLTSSRRCTHKNTYFNGDALATGDDGRLGAVAVHGDVGHSVGDVHRLLVHTFLHVDHVPPAIRLWQGVHRHRDVGEEPGHERLASGEQIPFLVGYPRRDGEGGESSSSRWRSLWWWLSSTSTSLPSGWLSLAWRSSMAAKAAPCWMMATALLEIPRAFSTSVAHHHQRRAASGSRGGPPPPAWHTAAVGKATTAMITGAGPRRRKKVNYELRVIGVATGC
uniref:Uncharacterized protein n=1 Tax=Oryza brachyantha TaxID=4533 RepID=J3NCD7_ORYBR